MYLKVALLVLSVAYTQAAKCPVVRTAENFKPDQFAGIWHDLARYPNVLETSKECLSLSYAYNGDTFALDNVTPVEGPNFITATGTLQADGSIYFKGLIGPTKKEFEVGLTIVKVSDKFAIKYNCIENGDDIIEFAWVISRSANLSDADKAELIEFINSYPLIDMDRLFWIKFSDDLCKAYSD